VISNVGKIHGGVGGPCIGKLFLSKLLAIATIHSTILWSTLGGLVIGGQVTW